MKVTSIIQTLTRKKSHRITLLLLPIMLLILCACSKDSDNTNPALTPTVVKFTLDIVCPNMDSEVIANSSDGSQVNTHFVSFYNDNGKESVLIKQNGKIIDLGSFPISKTNSSGSEGRIEVDGSDKISANKPYDAYIIGGSWRWDSQGVYYKKQLSRGGNFSTFLKFSSSNRPSKVTANIAGTGEILFIINKSGSPIKFKHKGFNAEDKWYYSYAEVSIDNGKVVKSEDGEAESEIHDVSIFTGKNAHTIYTTYVPNGNKIHDAQLIAEIDGKEVRSSNRISSDINIQFNHSYVMFAIWDGEKLMLGDENGEPIIHICSDDGSSDYNVTEVRKDGTVILSSNSNVPKKGEILVSPPTSVAPYGFLYKVESVNSQGGKIEVKTREAYLNEVLPDAHIDMNIPFDNVVTHDGTRAFVTRGEKDVDLLNFSKGIVISHENDNLSLKGTGSIDFKSSIGIIYDSERGVPQRCGGRFEGSLELKLSFEAALQKRQEYTIPNYLDIDLMTACFWVGPVPISATFHLVADAQIEATGKAYFKWTPVKSKLFTYETHVIWNKEPDHITGENWDTGCSGSNPLSDFSWSGMFENLLNGLTDTELGLNGEVKMSIRPRLQARLYNQENIMVGIGIAPYVKAEGELAIHYKADKGLDEDIELKDNLSLSVGVDIPLEGKVKFGDYGAELPKTGEKSKLSLFNYPIVQQASFFPAYNNFSVFPEDDAKHYSSVHISALKGEPALAWLAPNEEEFGFCYALIEKNSNGKELPRQWKYINLSDKYAAYKNFQQQYTIETDIPTPDLKVGAKYEVRPYSKLNIFGYIKRKGGKFKTGGATGDGGGEIIDVPGEDL